MEKRLFKKPSIRDVAKRAEVSATTVSHVVSGTPGYSAETIKRVREAIAALNYVPSYAANALRQRATRTIGVCATDPFVAKGRDSGSFSDRLWAGILAEADANRYKVMHFPESIRASEDTGEFLNGQIDGLIMCANRYDRRPETLARAGLPVVMVARKYDIPDGVATVAIEESQVILAALQHLESLGHREIAYVAGPAYDTEDTEEPPKSYDDVARARLETYLEWCATRGYAPRYFVSRGWEPESLTDTIRAWHADPPLTAVLGASDTFAREVLSAAKELGIAVPGDLSVIGIDNDQDAALSDPPLTTLEVPIYDVGRQAVRALLGLLAGDALPTSHPHHLAPVLVSRRSTGPCPRNP
ncbi:MAG: LacI family DNA-binding transcriptional regulator [Fimbriimonadaceae bacterium]|nr:LacI family DNA-binding transcriptional regulator [Fimbriimonadaceae bacterium]